MGKPRNKKPNRAKSIISLHNMAFQGCYAPHWVESLGLPSSGFSIADITAVVTVDFARAVRVKAGEQHGHLLRWRAAMALRPSMAL